MLILRREPRGIAVKVLVVGVLQLAPAQETGAALVGGVVGRGVAAGGEGVAVEEEAAAAEEDEWLLNSRETYQ